MSDDNANPNIVMEGGFYMLVKFDQNTQPSFENTCMLTKTGIIEDFLSVVQSTV